MHAAVVGAVAGIAFQRRIGRQLAAFGVADEQAAIGRDQLALRIDDGEHAAHEGQGMQGLAAGFQMQLVQLRGP